MDGYLGIGCVLEDRVPLSYRGIPHTSRFGTVPVGGDGIVEIHKENRDSGFRS